MNTDAGPARSCLSDIFVVDALRYA